MSHEKFTQSEYLAWEERQTERHFYVAGEIYSMAGGTAEHNSIAGNAFSMLRQHLKGAPCKTFIGDMRVQVALADAYFYPDVVVSCDANDVSDPKISTITAPVLIVEVLSPSTASYDRGQKFAAYRTLDSLKEYVWLDPELKTVDVFYKNSAGVWELHASAVATDIVKLRSVDWAGELGVFFEN